MAEPFDLAKAYTAKQDHMLTGLGLTPQFTDHPGTKGDATEEQWLSVLRVVNAGSRDDLRGRERFLFVVRDEEHDGEHVAVAEHRLGMFGRKISQQDHGASLPRHRNLRLCGSLLCI